MTSASSVTTANQGRRRAFFFMGWGALVLVVFWAALNIPVFSRQTPSMGVVSHPRLFPYYYQTNSDAQLELSSSLGFPEYYRVMPMRINRPLVYGSIAGIRNFLVRPIVNLVAGKEAQPLMWGYFSARDYLMTYSIWLVVNLLLMLGALVIYFRLMTKYFDRQRATLACIMLLTSPIILLSLREIHLGAFQVFTGLVCVAFWHQMLLQPLRIRYQVLASLGLGVLYLGKLGPNVFATGMLICLWMGQGQKLLWILPSVAFPTAAWVLWVKLVGLHFGVSEVQDFGAGVWILKVGSLGNMAHEFAQFLKQWCNCLGEDISLLHLPFFVVGLRSLWRQGRRIFLSVAGFSLLVDMGFYFLLHRMNATYGMSALLFFFIVTAEGMVVSASWLAPKLAILRGEKARVIVTVALLLMIQLALNYRQLPHYSG